MPVEAVLPCRLGYHMAAPEGLIEWAAWAQNYSVERVEIWLAQGRGMFEVVGSKVCFESARVITRLGPFNRGDCSRVLTAHQQSIWRSSHYGKNGNLLESLWWAGTTEEEDDEISRKFANLLLGRAGLEQRV